MASPPHNKTHQKSINLNTLNIRHLINVISLIGFDKLQIPQKKLTNDMPEKNHHNIGNIAISDAEKVYRPSPCTLGVTQGPILNPFSFPALHQWPSILLSQYPVPSIC